ALLGDVAVRTAPAVGADASSPALVRLWQQWLLAEALSFTRERPAPESSEEELVARARRNEPEAMQALYQLHAAAVYRRLTHLVGADPEREDLMQEVFVDLFRQLDRYRGRGNLRSYILRIVTHKACDHLRHRQRRRRLSAEVPRFRVEDAVDGRELSSGTPSPEERLGHAQELALVEQALEKLTPKKRIAFLLRVVDNLSLKEIADQVGATVFTVAQRLRHADRELQRHLARGKRDRP
ncbi:MAG TPA: sigma-70 family RNA polymerase sigma factor, partial [Polyangia bacterium]